MPASTKPYAELADNRAPYNFYWVGQTKPVQISLKQTFRASELDLNPSDHS